jgi:uncharacterized protein
MIQLVAAVAAAYLGLCAVLFLSQRALLFPAPRTRIPVVGTGRIIEVLGGTPMLWRQANDDGPVVVHFHGNGEQIADEAWLGEELARRGVSFAAVEYPGYPGASGAPSEDSILGAGENALRHLTTGMGISRERVVLSGQSLGTGVAVTLASRGWGTKLALLSPFPSLAAVAARGPFRIFPVQLLLRDRFDSAARAPRIDRPVLVLHGNRDEVIPFDLGSALARRFPNARFVEVEGAHHNDLWKHPPTMAEYLAFVAR